MDTDGIFPQRPDVAATAGLRNIVAVDGRLGIIGATNRVAGTVAVRTTWRGEKSILNQRPSVQAVEIHLNCVGLFDPELFCNLRVSMANAARLRQVSFENLRARITGGENEM